MIEKDAIGIATFLKVIIGPLLQAGALDYGTYRYRHGRVATTGRMTQLYLFGLLAVVRCVAVVIIAVGSYVISREKDRTVTGSPTSPKERGSGIDKTDSTQGQKH